MSDPFLIHGPAVISFSGGRTSGMMLHRILEAHGGTLPDDVKVVFCNTGKERAETLEFVERCSQRWGVSVTWLEYRFVQGGVSGKRKPDQLVNGSHSFVVVDFSTASRNGEPFEQVITARNMLPNVMARFCTVELKIRTTDRYLKSLGWKHWDNAIGFRADEPKRVARVSRTNRHAREEPFAPLARAGITLADVTEFWRQQPFDLELQSHEGNCDLCFLKGIGKVQRVMKDRPELAEWWIKAEATANSRGLARNPSVAYFRKDRPSYAAMLEMSKRPTLFPVEELDELSVSCHCTD